LIDILRDNENFAKSVIRITKEYSDSIGTLYLGGEISLLKVPGVLF